MMPYGPAGIKLRPRRCKRMMLIRERNVETALETSTKDYLSAGQPEAQVADRKFSGAK